MFINNHYNKNIFLENLNGRESQDANIEKLLQVKDSSINQKAYLKDSKTLANRAKPPHLFTSSIASTAYFISSLFNSTIALSLAIGIYKEFNTDSDARGLADTIDNIAGTFSYPRVAKFVYNVISVFPGTKTWIMGENSIAQVSYRTAKVTNQLANLVNDLLSNRKAISETDKISASVVAGIIAINLCTRREMVNGKEQLSQNMLGTFIVRSGIAVAESIHEVVYGTFSDFKIPKYIPVLLGATGFSAYMVLRSRTNQQKIQGENKTKLLLSLNETYKKIGKRLRTQPQNLELLRTNRKFLELSLADLHHNVLSLEERKNIVNNLF